MKHKSAMWVLLTAILLISSQFSIGCMALTQAGEFSFKIERVDERVLVIQSQFWALNMIAIDAGEGLVVIDSFALPQEAAEGRKIVEETFGKRVTHLINSHYHWDHTFGNQAFANTTIIAHELCVEDMRSEYSTREGAATVFKRGEQAALPFDIDKFELTLPTVVYTRKKAFEIGDLTFVLYHQPGLHTRSHSTIHIPELGLVALRGEFHPGSLPALEEGINLAQLIPDLEEILANEAGLKFIVQGHGDPYAGPGIDFHIDYLKALQEATKKYKSSDSVQDSDFPEAAMKRIKSDAALSRRHRENLSVLFSQEK